MEIEDVVTELVEIILMQEKEIKQLKNKVNRINQYIEVYEELIKGE